MAWTKTTRKQYRRDGLRYASDTTAKEKTPVEIIDQLNKEINVGLADPKIAARIADLASQAFIASPADLDKLVVGYTEKWGKVIRAANIKAE
jgi:tripartite-type tricarboxylate transporter receptor subunit TctC